MKIINVILYTTKTNKQPFAEWQKKLTTKTESIVLARLARVRGGNFGDAKPIKGATGLYELRIDYGAGYRIYYGKIGTTIIVLF